MKKILLIITLLLTIMSCSNPRQDREPEIQALGNYKNGIVQDKVYDKNNIKGYYFLYIEYKPKYSRTGMYEIAKVRVVPNQYSTINIGDTIK